jgi:hypothetical protein
MIWRRASDAFVIWAVGIGLAVFFVIGVVTTWSTPPPHEHPPAPLYKTPRP